MLKSIETLIVLLMHKTPGKRALKEGSEKQIKKGFRSFLGITGVIQGNQLLPRTGTQNSPDLDPQRAFSLFAGLQPEPQNVSISNLVMQTFNLPTKNCMRRASLLNYLTELIRNLWADCS